LWMSWQRHFGELPSFRMLSFTFAKGSACRPYSPLRILLVFSCRLLWLPELWDSMKAAAFVQLQVETMACAMK
jgi:hypothetical protein